MTLRESRTQAPFSIWPVMLVAAVLLLAGCNTFRGVGEDVEAGGEAIQGASDETSESIDDATD